MFILLPSGPPNDPQPAFGRILHLGSWGADVLAVKRALARAGYGHLRGLTRLFGIFTVRNLKHFQRDHHLFVDGIYGATTHRRLAPYFDAYARKLYDSVVVYHNPLAGAKNLSLQRTDQGVDYFAAKGTGIFAIGNARITRATTNSGWPGGGCVQYVLLDGPHKGEEIYVAEFVAPLVKEGQYVSAGHEIAYFTRDTSDQVGIEMGYLRPGTDQPCSSDMSGVETAAGKAFARFLRSLGCPTLQDPGPGSDRSPCA